MQKIFCRCFMKICSVRGTGPGIIHKHICIKRRNRCGKSIYACRIAKINLRAGNIRKHSAKFFRVFFPAVVCKQNPVPARGCQFVDNGFSKTGGAACYQNVQLPPPFCLCAAQQADLHGTFGNCFRFSVTVSCKPQLKRKDIDCF